MKLNRILTLCAIVAAASLSAGSLFAQDNGNNGGQGGQGDQGGQRRNRQGGGNWDPAQMQQRMVDGVRDRLNFTNDTEWAAVEPLVTKVVTARMESMAGGMRGMMGGRNRQGGGQGGRGFGPANPEGEALQKAIDDDAPAAQVKELLAKYKAAQKAKLAKLEAAQADLKAVLTTKQEAQAVLLGLVN